MEQIKYEKCMPWLMAAGRYIKREADRAECPDCAMRCGWSIRRM